MISSYEYDSVPNLPKRTVDMANVRFTTHPSFDDVFAGVVFKAQDRVHLELLKMAQPGEAVMDSWYELGFRPKYGFVPITKTDFHDWLDVERLLVERHSLKADKKYAEADAIRKRLESWGYEIGDEPGGTNWIAA